MRKYSLIAFIIIIASLSACKKVIDPKLDNSLTLSQLSDDPKFAEGLLLNSYLALPNDYNFETDVATDDAVTNDPKSVYRNMALGGWRSTNDPISQWRSAYANIFSINQFLSIYQNVVWSNSPNLTAADNATRNTLHKKRMKGEAYGLRAWYKWRLLQYHGGIASDGTLRGFPIIDSYIKTSDNWSVPRNTYAECVANIFADLDTAYKNLPPTWVDLPTGGANPAINVHINATSGARFLNRINGNSVLIIKSRVALLAASPAFSAGSGVTWAQAATFAGPLLKSLGALYANGVTFYLERNNKEMVWNAAEIQKRSWEQNNFPPSLFGSGRTNPSQNLVDAFGMKNGYPIGNAASTYNAATPYTNRDPRFAKYIVYNSAILKTPSIIYSYKGAPMDGINALFTSTRTGYYLKKFMNETVKLDPGNSVNAGHTYSLARMTELLLNYAEAANEAWGPDGDPNGYGFTARTLIASLRSRGGISPDPYLATLTTTATLRTLIQNERRIELCFEGFRFWDIRRWNDVATMQTPVKGVYITNTAGVYSYVYSNIEERKFAANMIYGPIPYNETLKYNLQQNKDW